MEFTRDNIEDWDFRSYVSPMAGTPAERMRVQPGVEAFLSENYLHVMAVDTLRLAHLQSLIEGGFARLCENGSDVLLEEPLGPRVLHYSTAWRDILTRDGRFNRRVVKALEREWDKNGRIRLTLLPPDLRQVFPGLFDEADE